MPRFNEMIRDEYEDVIESLNLSETSIAHIDVMYDSDERTIAVKSNFDDEIKKACGTFEINELMLKDIIKTHQKTISEEIMMLIQNKEESIW